MDSEISQLLRSLPRTKASDAFTRNVMRKIDLPDSIRWWRYGLVPAALALTVAMLAGHHVLETREERHQMQILKVEQKRLSLELEQLKSITPMEPVLYVGSNGTTDYVVDLGEGNGSQAIVPASYSTNTF